MVFWKGQLRRVDNHFRTGKQLLSRGYSNTKHFLNKVNEGYEVSKEVYKIVRPALEALSGSHHQLFRAIDNKVNKAIHSYENVRNHVLDSHQQVENHVGGIVEQLKKKNINIGLN